MIISKILNVNVTSFHSWPKSLWCSTLTLLFGSIGISTCVAFFSAVDSGR